ncbi:hypothetical protein [Brasilonema sp. UFV-L1]|uniref:hypothetical protein n=1 Tax=Brasilonema sp. UFV-L1 TaxID=2234130 RepID=UPI00145FC86B|nr:hypothetical protein [Brasilonema sp. UFV-L1]
MRDINRRWFMLGTLTTAVSGSVMGLLNRLSRTWAMPTMEQKESPSSAPRQVIKFTNGISLELVTRNNEFLGVGRIAAGNIALRSGRRPMFVEIRNPNGIHLCNYTIAQHNITDNSVELQFSMHYREGGLMEWMLHSVRNRYNTADWTTEPLQATDTVLWLKIRPVTRNLGGRKYIGLSYQYRYQSQSIPIYKILDRGTWELGGHAVGNEFWMRHSFTPSITSVDSVEQLYSTEWYLPSATNPNALQFLPLQTVFQGFTFTAAKAGTLVTWAKKVSHIRSLFEKPRGVDEIVHWHEHCADLGKELVTSPIEVLWAPGELDRVGRANAYEAVRELVYETLHTQIGMRRERVTTYSMIEQWDNADLKRYTQLGLPKLLKAGIKTVGLANHFQNNMNTFGVGNMACTIDWKVADSVGEENLRAFCNKAKANGAKVEMWGNTALSTFGLKQWDRNGAKSRIDYLPKEGSIMEVIERSRDPFVRNLSNAIESDHYAPVFAVLNLRDPVIREYWLKQWKQAHDEIGLEGIFLDSSSNLSSDKFHFIQLPNAGSKDAATGKTHQLFNERPAQEPPAAILSQYYAHLELMTQMQKIGYRYCGEDIGVFGVHRSGPPILARLDNLPLWAECITDFDVLALQKASVNPNEVFFRGLAYRMMWYMFWDIKSDQLSFNYGSLRGDFDRPTDWHILLLKVFSKVNDLMINREILRDQKGVVYRVDGQQILWAFQNFDFKLSANSLVRDENTGKNLQTNVLHAVKHHVYRING